jgi:hypothetical protein
MRPILPALVLLSLALLPGCGKKMGEAAVAAASGGKVAVHQDGDKTTVTTAGGQVTLSSGEGATLPGGFPADITLPSGYKLETAADFGGNYTLSLVVPGDAAALAGDASKSMQGQGWKQAMEMNQPDAHVLMFQKDKRAANFTFSPNTDAGGGTRVTVTASQEQ